MAEEQEIIFQEQTGVGIITLNRPQALNALTWSMVKKLDDVLVKWGADNSIKAVIIEGAGERAFCSGGDVKSVALAGKDSELAKDFFRDEYIMNNRIFNFPKPYISLIDGIVMGGGKGVSAHGSHRIVTEKVLFAMPETNIGFFPDVGGGYFLPRCPGQTGVYLALTSKRIKEADCIYIGFATHFVPSAKLSELRSAIIQAPEQLDELLAKFAQTPDGESEIAPYREKIDKYFGRIRVEDMVSDLRQDGSLWAKETLDAMNSMSPTSLKIALKQIRLGANMSFADVMVMEYRVSQHCMQHADFYEGIRAALIDKDRSPKWQPADINDVSDEAVGEYFASLGDRDLNLNNT